MSESSVDVTLQVLKDASGTKLSTKELESKIGIQANTLVKNMKFLRDAGHDVMREDRISDSGKKYSVWWLGTGKKTGRQFRQHNELCGCVLSYWSVNGLCNRCGTERKTVDTRLAYTPRAKGKR